MKCLSILPFAVISVLLSPLVVFGEPKDEATADAATTKASRALSHTATIDIEKIMASYDLLEHRLAELLQEVEQFADEVEEKQEAIAKKKQKLRLTYKLDSPDYLRAAEEVAKAEGELSALAELRRTQFRRRESRLYYQAFKTIQEEIRNFAEEHNISLVLNATQDAVDKDDPIAVETRIRERVVYQRNRDITVTVLSKLNSKQTSGDVRPRLTLGYRRIETLRASGLRFPFHKPPRIHRSFGFEIFRYK